MRAQIIGRRTRTQYAAELRRIKETVEKRKGRWKPWIGRQLVGKIAAAVGSILGRDPVGRCTFMWAIEGRGGGKVQADTRSQARAKIKRAAGINKHHRLPIDSGLCGRLPPMWPRALPEIAGVRGAGVPGHGAAD